MSMGMCTYLHNACALPSQCYKLVSAANDHDVWNSSIAIREFGPSLESFYLVMSLEAKSDINIQIRIEQLAKVCNN